MIPVIEMDILKLILEKRVLNCVKLIGGQPEKLNSRGDGPPAGNAEKFVNLPDITALILFNDRGMYVVELLITVFIIHINEEIFMRWAEFFRYNGNPLAVLFNIRLAQDIG